MVVIKTMQFSSRSVTKEGTGEAKPPLEKLSPSLEKCVGAIDVKHMLSM